MNKNTVVSFSTPAERVEDSLTTVLREGARKLLSEAVEGEVRQFLSDYRSDTDDHGNPRVVRNGYLPERTIQSGIGPIKVQVPRVRDRSQSGIRFNSTLIPPYLKRTQNIEELLPILYLKGISTGDFSEALESLVGPRAKGLSASTICRLKESWQEDHSQWCKRDLSNKR